jgi:hypothetical protein
MDKPSTSPVLPIAYVALRIAIIINWVWFGAIVVLLVAMPNRAWIMSAFDIKPSPETDRLIFGMRAVAAIGAGAILLNYAVLKRLLAIVDTVRGGDPFVAANAKRLQEIAWTLFALQFVGGLIGVIVKAIATPATPLNIGAGFSVNGWLAVLLTFVLARVFAQATTMRDDLEGTV